MTDHGYGTAPTPLQTRLDATAMGRSERPVHSDLGLRLYFILTLLSQAERLNNRTIPFDIDIPKIIQQIAAAAHHL